MYGGLSNNRSGIIDYSGSNSSANTGAICLFLIFGIPLILATYGMIFIAGFALAVILEIMQYAFTGNS